MNEINRGLSKERLQALMDFQKSLGIRFKDIALLETALSHKSFVNESPTDLENNEKLEFLGDAYLGLIVSAVLYNQNLYFKEGTLARIKSYVVSEPTLYRIGKEINIQKYILIGKGEEKTGGRNRKALISDCVEAVIGAYYLDAGYRGAKKMVQRLFYKEIIEVEKNRHEKDYKSILQELSQKRYRIVPQYSVVNTRGPDHNRRFYVNVNVRKRSYGPGVGSSKKEAEQMAAGIALRHLLKLKGLRDTGIERTESDRDPSQRKGNVHGFRRGKRAGRSRSNARARAQR
jgi:ribonuclease-3